ncbi:phosphatase PAP2 family protein [Streptomyces sp. BE303]|uniref:phosphatase PAP2 family protein n=1 Tax=Streptomyces sp. BE303 TaxID=3002528 RepID=UPI002E788C4C|nr:phosphatase PAP2 family protein [Streptomyces sp. BE303]MED7949213.1 phosphatase PAP2 family protein [Streptomyces sp. BE303]
MTVPAPAPASYAAGPQAAYDGSGVDGGLYTRVVGWADAAPHWLDRLVALWSALGLALFALLMLAAWWRARGAGSVVIARVLASPLIVVVAYAVNSVFKGVVEEVRPCAQLGVRDTLETCPGPGDWSFPSNHTVVAFAAAAALWFADRWIGWIAGVAAVLMGASRVWVGVHYPHDVLAGAVVGVLVALPLASVAGRAAPLVDRVRSGPLRPLLGAGLPAPAGGRPPATMRRG